MGHRLLRKGFLSCALLLLVVATTLVGLGAKTLLVIRADNGQLQSLPLAPTALPGPKSRLLVVAPHPDDESLGCAGLIRRARLAGASVSVVLLTNGDSFPAAVVRQSGDLQPEPTDYIRFGYVRQQEALRALRGLGVRKQDVYFLGYPDRGLSQLWTSYWTPARPYRAKRTDAIASPYAFSRHRNALHCGQSLLRDLVGVLRQVRPTDVYVTHPNDDHGDHWAGFCFTIAALRRLAGEEEAARDPLRPSLHTYLVHRGNWPVPQGYHPRMRLVPPAGMSHLDTWWTSLDLTPDDVRAKRAAVECYRSQVSIPVERRFMMSFVRSNELFGRYDYEAPPAGPETDFLGEPHRLRIYDPSADKLVRQLNGSADLQLVEAVETGPNVEVRLHTRGGPSRWVRYLVTLRGLAEDPRREAGLVVSVTPPARASVPSVSVSCEGRDLLLTVPRRLLGSSEAVVVGAQTLSSGLTVDRSAWKVLPLQPQER